MFETYDPPPVPGKGDRNTIPLFRVSLRPQAGLSTSAGAGARQPGGVAQRGLQRIKPGVLHSGVSPGAQAGHRRAHCRLPGGGGSNSEGNGRRGRGLRRRAVFGENRQSAFQRLGAVSRLQRGDGIRLPVWGEGLFRFFDGVEAGGHPRAGFDGTALFRLRAAVVTAVRFGLFLRGAVAAGRAEHGDGDADDCEEANPAPYHNS